MTLSDVYHPTVAHCTAAPAGRRNVRSCGSAAITTAATDCQPWMAQLPAEARITRACLKRHIKNYLPSKRILFSTRNFIDNHAPTIWRLHIEIRIEVNANARL
ncbi:hypothetical protein ABQ137_12625 [Xanthomonas sp. WHRI 8393]|uniref:hypothetical protein n=1 Tax=Xanthomonas sp. WHRI 8393 TaxID=3161574 RepID=UPI0032E85C4A